MRGEARPSVRLRFAKHGKIRWISHRDTAHAFERAFRIEALPLAFTQGFSPRPKVSFGLALSTGYESDKEFLDVSFPRAGGARRAARRDSTSRFPPASRSRARMSSMTARPRCKRS